MLENKSESVDDEVDPLTTKGFLSRLLAVGDKIANDCTSIVDGKPVEDKKKADKDYDHWMIAFQLRLFNDDDLLQSASDVKKNYFQHYAMHC